MSMSGERTIVLRCLDELLEVEEAVALQSPTIKQWKDNCDAGNHTRLNVTTIIMAKVANYCKFHLEAAANKAHGDAEVPAIGATPEEVKRFDADFMNVDETTLFELLVAAKYLEIKSLMELSCVSVTKLIRRKTSEEVRAMFNMAPTTN